MRPSVPASRGVFTRDSFRIPLRDFDTANDAFVFPTTTRRAMLDYLIAELRKHGTNLPDGELAARPEMDVGLNVMGLEHWLEHR